MLGKEVRNWNSIPKHQLFVKNTVGPPIASVSQKRFCFNAGTPLIPKPLYISLMFLLVRGYDQLPPRQQASLHHTVVTPQSHGPSVAR